MIDDFGIGRGRRPGQKVFDKNLYAHMLDDWLGSTLRMNGLIDHTIAGCHIQTNSG